MTVSLALETETVGADWEKLTRVRLLERKLGMAEADLANTGEAALGLDLDLDLEAPCVTVLTGGRGRRRWKRRRGREEEEKELEGGES